MAATPPPSSTLSIDCPAGVTHLVVRIDRVPLQRHLSRLLGRAIHRDIEFAVPFDLTASRANRWNFGVQMLHAELMDGGSLLQRRAGLGPVEEFLMSSLLYAQRSNYTEELLGERPHPGALVRAACRYIDANLSEPIVVSEIAQSVGVSLRTLQKHFVDQLHQTLSHYVRDRRLDRVRAELAAAAPGSGPSVSDVAERWGFTHLGRFAAAYRDRFGEAPSATLRT